MMQDAIFEPDVDTTVLVVGDIILDQYIYGETNRISPEAPVPVIRVNEMEERPGGAANVAINISSLGVNVHLLGITGHDDAAKRLDEILVEKGVTCHFIYQDSFPTITKQRVLSQHQQLLRLDYEEASNSFDTVEVIEKYIQLLDSVDVVILSDYAKGSLSRVEELIKQANNKNVTVLVDPKSTDFNRYRQASIITPNLKELEAIVGTCSNDEQLVKKASDFFILTLSFY